MLEAGCQVLGARTPRRPARFLVSENRIWYQPKGAIILCDDKIIRRQLKRARRGLRLLSSEAYASIHGIEDRPDSEDEIARWMEKLRRNGNIDGFVTSREVFNSIHCSSRRTVLGIDPEEREGLPNVVRSKSTGLIQVIAEQIEFKPAETGRGLSNTGV